MKIEGVPDGWELVRIGKPKKGEWIVGDIGTPGEVFVESETYNFPIIRRIPPPLSIPPKVFRSGWIIENPNTGHSMWSATKPHWEKDEWYGASSIWVVSAALGCVTFSNDLAPFQRICRVTWEHGSECEQ